jgi:hypothetical protein
MRWRCSETPLDIRKLLENNRYFTKEKVSGRYELQTDDVTWYM